MRKLFFIATMTLSSSFIFASASMPNSGVKSSPPDYNKPVPPRTVTPQSSHVPKPIPSKPVTPQSYTPKPTPTKPIAPSLPCVPKPIPIETIIPPSSTSNLNILHGGNTNSEIQKNSVSVLSNIGQQQKESTQSPKQIQASEQQNRHDKPNFRSKAGVIDDWNKTEKTTEKVRKKPKKEQKDDRVTSCEQILADLEECFYEDEAFWQLRNSYIYKGCEKNVHIIEKSPETVCYSVPYGITLAYYKGWYFTKRNIANSAIGDAFLGDFPLVICSIAYTSKNFLIGKSFSVELIKNYKQSQHETYDLKLLREATEKYAGDLQYALNRCLYRGAVGTVPISSILYIAMCYGYDDDPDAKVVTIIDKENKQHIFVIPNNSIFNSVIQISDGSSEVNALMSYRYLVPESTILALNINRRY